MPSTVMMLDTVRDAKLSGGLRTPRMPAAIHVHAAHIPSAKFMPSVRLYATPPPIVRMKAMMHRMYVWYMGRESQESSLYSARFFMYCGSNIFSSLASSSPSSPPPSSPSSCLSPGSYFSHTARPVLRLTPSPRASTSTPASLAPSVEAPPKPTGAGLEREWAAPAPRPSTPLHAAGRAIAPSSAISASVSMGGAGGAPQGPARPRTPPPWDVAL
mmetsp:Transcript_22543/g.76664  ORF Transcript_22543/g.76664 Transcript_22543/m.76664 type:complete len:215 (-) Transcript_22543:129-773(-)